MFLSDIFYWELTEHLILETIKAELSKFSDATVKIFHSFLCKSIQKHIEAQQIIKYSHCINYLRLDDNGFKENFAHTSTWVAYKYSAWDITFLTKKCACFLLQYFSKMHTRIFLHRLLILFLLQINPSLKQKGVEKFEVSLTAIKMLKAQLYHLPLDFSTISKPDQFRYCNATNCLIFSIINIDDPIEVLACGYTYHESCYSNNQFKCLYCLSFLHNGVDDHVKSLLESLQSLDKKRKVQVEPKNDISCDDDDNESEPVNYATSALEEALQKF